jgi:hypothetical protein
MIAVWSSEAGKATFEGPSSRASSWTSRPRLLKRGAAAWNQSARSETEALTGFSGEPNRLLVHAITDDSLLKSYAPAVHRFLDFAVKSGALLLEQEDKDLAFADYLAYLCYDLDKGIGEGKSALAGWCHIFVGEHDRLPRAKRALVAWERLAVTGEGIAVPWPAVWAIAKKLRQQGHEESADLVLLSADAYLRESDWAMIASEDIIVTGTEVAILLGVPERGEATKTGVRQGVRPDRPWAAQLWAKYKQRTPKGQKVFLVKAAAFRQHWRQACAAFEFDPGPPHQLRHTGPSYDLFVQYRTSKEVKNRGRWRSDTSVLRYAKAHAYLAALARLPAKVLKAAEPYEHLTDHRNLKPVS